jgi:hypothetical protein
VDGKDRVVPVGPGLVNAESVMAASAAGVELEPDEVERAQAVWIKTMREAAVPPELVYACETTGMIVTKSNRHLFTAPELSEWEGAAQAFREKVVGHVR